MIYGFNHIHRATALFAPVFGALIGMNEVADRFDKKGSNPIDTFVLCIPEMCFGGVCGYFWMYTMLPFSFYKRHTFFS